ncbi:unnamed protein product, partial [Adineta steineri]
MIVGQVLLGLAGLGLTCYAYYVKQQHKKNPKYKALCDLGPNASCSRVLTSKYGIGLGLTTKLFGENSIMNASNVNLGIVLYILQIIFGIIEIIQCLQIHHHQMKQKPTTKITSICQVCGDEASIINYGALTCLSCRTFFRRNGFNTKDVYLCRFGAKCELTKLSRKHCAACRLAKCLAVGMSSDLIRKEDLTSPKRKEDLTGLKRKSTTPHEQKFVENKTIMTIPQANALDFPADDCLRSNLNSSDWTIISNVIHAFDTFSPVPEIRRTIETITTSASSFQFDLNRTLQLISSFSNCLQLFISSVPDFKILTTSEQWSLLQRNMFGLLS